MALAKVQAETLNKFLRAWKEQKPDEITALWSEDFNQRVLPLSLKIPVKSRSEAVIMNNILSSKLTNWKVCYLIPAASNKNV
jgi:hypothetical protein